MANQMDSRVDLTNLLTRCHDMERRLDDMGHRYDVYIQRTMDNAKSKVEESDRERRQLLDDQKELEEQIEHVSHQIRDEGQKLAMKQECAAQLAKETEDLKQKHQIMAVRLTQAKAERNILKEKLVRIQADKNDMRRRHAIESKNAQAELDAIKDITRLRITSPGVDRTRFEFTHIDEHDLDRVFYVTLDIAATRVYSVSECVPELATVQELIDQLNKDRDLPKFIKQIRKAFCDATALS
ncbi:hypothetical protein EC973_007799 [Apophysomyces ossiformis]|uniref:Kinetochore protein SPC25 n=1 Tax=Apophysomyces ossiformis TaxID=679940 RepID=A0A8H7EU20_9FUNG|nr:hypothetical protein EC973_007799 [Apophysomyces ossiformis]